jgi:hypothetical protein
MSEVSKGELEHLHAMATMASIVQTFVEKTSQA